jgi:branched-chain amino acid transport system permease protein
MELLLTNIIYGICYGMLLFIVASGLALVFGVMGVLNMAHGAFYMLGAYLGIIATRAAGNWLFGLLVAIVSIALIGLAVDRGLLRHLYKQLNEQVLLTVGLIYIFSNVVQWLWAAPNIWSQPAPSILSGVMNLKGIPLPVYRLALIVVGAALYIGLSLLLKKTRAGAIVRAGMDDKQMVTGLGLNYGLTSTIVFVLGSAMGGLAGFLGTPILGATPEMGTSILLLAVVATIVGGVGSIEGTMVGSLLIGLVDAVGKAYFPFYAMFTPYALMIFILLVRPSGLVSRGQ